MKKVLILCTHNSCRSQIAEGLVNHFLKRKWKAFSAGADPVDIDARTTLVMQEIGIDISSHHPKSISEFLDRKDIDLVVTVCDDARENCPLFPAKVKTVHLPIEDPAQATRSSLEFFRKVRDQIKAQLFQALESSHRPQSWLFRQNYTSYHNCPK